MSSRGRIHAIVLDMAGTLMGSHRARASTDGGD